MTKRLFLFWLVAVGLVLVGAPSSSIADHDHSVVLTNAVLDLEASPATVTLHDLNGAMTANEGIVWQMVDGTPQQLSIVSWTPKTVVVELVAVEPGDYMILLKAGDDKGSIGNITVTIPDGRPDPPCYSDLSRSRFVNCGNGTVTDTATGVIWLERASCVELPRSSFADANELALALEDGRCGLSDGSRPGDWRLAAMDEWQKIVDPTCGPPAIAGNVPFGGCYSEAPWAIGVLSDWYWSSNTIIGTIGNAWFADLSLGTVRSGIKPNDFLVWPVRSSR